MPSESAALPAFRQSRWPLFGQLVRRDVRQRYQGSALGLLWSFLMPLFMLGIYTFVFSVIFKSRWQTPEGEAPLDTGVYALILFTGLSIHLFFSECLTRAPQLILNHASYVTRVVFPLEILPPMMVASAGFHYVTTMTVLFTFLLALTGGIPLTALWLPFVLLPMVVLLLGLSWLLASLGVFLRDLGHLMQLVPTVLLFLSPIFYPTTALPVALRPFMVLNPLTLIVENAREVLIFGRPPHWLALGVYLCISLVVTVLSYLWFQRTRKAFADIL